jgi:hypothetical protein
MLPRKVPKAMLPNTKVGFGPGFQFLTNARNGTRANHPPNKPPTAPAAMVEPNLFPEKNATPEPTKAPTSSMGVEQQGIKNSQLAKNPSPARIAAGTLIVCSFC